MMKCERCGFGLRPVYVFPAEVISTPYKTAGVKVREKICSHLECLNCGGMMTVDGDYKEEGNG